MASSVRRRRALIPADVDPRDLFMEATTAMKTVRNRKRKRIDDIEEDIVDNTTNDLQRGRSQRPDKIVLRRRKSSEPNGGGIPADAPIPPWVFKKGPVPDNLMDLVIRGGGQRVLEPNSLLFQMNAGSGSGSGSSGSTSRTVGGKIPKEWKLTSVIPAANLVELNRLARLHEPRIRYIFDHKFHLATLGNLSVQTPNGSIPTMFATDVALHALRQFLYDALFQIEKYGFVIFGVPVNIYQWATDNRVYERFEDFAESRRNSSSTEENTARQRTASPQGVSSDWRNHLPLMLIDPAELKINVGVYCDTTDGQKYLAIPKDGAGRDTELLDTLRREWDIRIFHSASTGPDMATGQLLSSVAQIMPHFKNLRALRMLRTESQIVASKQLLIEESQPREKRLVNQTQHDRVTLAATTQQYESDMRRDEEGVDMIDELLAKRDMTMDSARHMYTRRELERFHSRPSNTQFHPSRLTTSDAHSHEPTVDALYQLEWAALDAHRSQQIQVSVDTVNLPEGIHIAAVHRPHWFIPLEIESMQYEKMIYESMGMPSEAMRSRVTSSSSTGARGGSSGDLAIFRTLVQTTVGSMRTLMQNLFHFAYREAMAPIDAVVLDDVLEHLKDLVGKAFMELEIKEVLRILLQNDYVTVEAAEGGESATFEDLREQFYRLLADDHMVWLQQNVEGLRRCIALLEQSLQGSNSAHQIGLQFEQTVEQAIDHMLTPPPPPPSQAATENGPGKL